ncbi:MAG: DoxX family membrane protein [Bdellovibrionaceae bacterium]|nr:DoxX family membrane protein [Pseudobdellovibrionaceae bacterium]MDW8189776.1 DoxX family membrane protein [Pseudobdellovibrionaceae bacterium]
MIFSAFLESIKFIGHMLPVSFLRIFLGYVYFQQGLARLENGWLDKPILSSRFSDALEMGQVAPFFVYLIEKIGYPYWFYLTFLLIGIEIATGISYLLGYVVRPMSILIAIVTAFQVLAISTHDLTLAKLLLVVHIFLAWIGAGRVLGFDYYFFKRYRGFWW